MFSLTIADIVFRARQFLIATASLALILSMALMLSGLVSSVRVEVTQTVDATNADAWVMANSAVARITAFAAFPQSQVDRMRFEPGVRQADPILVLPFQVAHVDGEQHTINLIGVQRGGLGDPAVLSGRRLSGPDQAVVDQRLGAGLGSNFVVGGHTVKVVGIVKGRTLLGGIPVAYLTLASVQSIGVGGRPFITAVLTRGVPRATPTGLRASTEDQVIDSTQNQLKSDVASINQMRILMLFVAAAIVASLLYVAALERKRDFAVLKALGASSGGLFFSLVLEGIAVTVLASAAAEALSQLLSLMFSQPVDIQNNSYLALPITSAIVGAFASLMALRRATGADPVAAFG